MALVRVFLALLACAGVHGHVSKDARRMLLQNNLSCGASPAWTACTLPSGQEGICVGTTGTCSYCGAQQSADGNSVSFSYCCAGDTTCDIPNGATDALPGASSYCQVGSQPAPFCQPCGIINYSCCPGVAANALCGSTVGPDPTKYKGYCTTDPNYGSGLICKACSTFDQPCCPTSDGSSSLGKPCAFGDGICSTPASGSTKPICKACGKAGQPDCTVAGTACTKTVTYADQEWKNTVNIAISSVDNATLCGEACKTSSSTVGCCVFYKGQCYQKLASACVPANLHTATDRTSFDKISC